MANITLTIPNADVAEVLAAVESRWKPDAVRIAHGGDTAAFEALAPAQRLRQCLAAMLRVYVRNERRSKAEREAAQAVTEVDVT